MTSTAYHNNNDDDLVLRLSDHFHCGPWDIESIDREHYTFKYTDGTEEAIPLDWVL